MHFFIIRLYKGYYSPDNFVTFIVVRDMFPRMEELVYSGEKCCLIGCDNLVYIVVALDQLFLLLAQPFL